MEVKIFKLSDKYMSFEIDGITPSQANALRRTLINDIPKLAIENVTFHHGEIRDAEGNVYDSSLPLFDEMVAHRLGLIPLKTDLSLNFRDQCSCGGKGCSLCTVTYSINKIGPASVMSGDIQAISHPDLVPVDPDIPIVKLGAKQAILITAEAILGTAKEHAKWQVTSGVAYKYHREFEVNKKLFEDWAKIKERCPKSVLSEDENTIVFTDDYGCNDLSILFESDGVQIKEDDSRFIFHFETDGSLTAEETLSYALNRLMDRWGILVESLSE
ncbi:DNA-directed RNA polymerase D [Thermoplasma volcanium GSS1]|uniref:DNA-directed RNA polymerase subunit Rpo3 n=1 Tax=Thermoplasma volcanium (strain ATCC 51530 / DSM 4299 / JCM 9571 / NBRC 15438 / GSS1) TaxID=273116 RepID=RPO3_THEVO|nr:DNA-directed RNA polymerase subunit D [Thermoplasma volcanium]Q97B93.1 RecName: Full=DNA-directed RNA polymerase subunit Rpo3; AltName: Full=DNA-directed RNA polymerase subunit D [Thermoplasma volcanium GSS1]BAB59706.1 DNA-directed RNA polymerase D [Thermoplasma volcanium GSS1]